ncbi:MAG: hypothetical protein A2033_01990 [Bacteroidetes bacterium GWA2_31_9]|nr:MAG: hypothetical protein A2033_01990 [Bacteroidetes bacterium GWA2_31_9]
MNDIRLVCNFNIDLINNFQGKAIVIKTNNIDEIQHINHVVNKENKLHCIVVNHNGALSTLPVTDNWEGIPIHIFATRFGNFMQFIEQKHIYHKLSIRVFLSAEIETNYRDLQILSSFGIDCGLYFPNKSINWEKLNDLMYYSAYGKVQHASIEPFDFVIKKFEYNTPIDFSNVYFENPHQYLHISDEGKVALSGLDLHNCKFITENINDLENIHQSSEYKNVLNNWQNFFTKLEDCSCCPSWRICLGKFNHISDKTNTCQPFFNDLMDAAELFHENKSKFKTRELCQP